MDRQGSIANRDEARKCLAIARRALQEGDRAKAEKFVGKAKVMHNSEEILRAAMDIESMLAETSPSARPSAQPHRSEGGSHQQHAGAAGAHHQHANGHAHARQQDDGPSTSSYGAQAGPKLPRRTADATRRPAAAAPAQDEPDLGTPEQKALVAQVIKAKDFYEVLGVSKDAGESDIKKAYKKMALKLHPDKCKAKGGEEAFKKVSRAFGTLDNADTRAYYDRTGHENPQAAAAAAQAQRSGGASAGAHHYQQEIDPEEIFNAFFGGAFGNTRVYRSHFGGGQQRRQSAQQPAASDQSRAVLGLLQFLPIALIILYSMFQGTQQPSYSLIRDRTYATPLQTKRLDVEFFVRSEAEFEKTYPQGSSARYRLERSVESTFYEQLEERCQQERMLKQRAWAWGNREAALNMKMESCDKLTKLNTRLNARSGYHGGR